MGPERRLKKTLELSRFFRALLRPGLEITHTELEAGEFNALYRARMEKARTQAG